MEDDFISFSKIGKIVFGKIKSYKILNKLFYRWKKFNNFYGISEEFFLFYIFKRGLVNVNVCL